MKRLIFAVFAMIFPSLLPAGGAEDFARDSNIYSLRIFNLAVSQKLAKDTANLALAPALIQNQGGALFCGGAGLNAEAAFRLPQNPQECMAQFEKFGPDIKLREGGFSMASVIFTKRFLPLKPGFAKTAKSFGLGLDSFNPELAEVAAVKIGQWLEWISCGFQNEDFSSSYISPDANLMLMSSAAFDFSSVRADSEADIKFAFKSGQVVEKSAARFSRGVAIGEFPDFDAAIFTPQDCAFSVMFFKPKTMQRAKAFLANLDAETFENSFKVLKLLAQSGDGSQIVVPKFSFSGGVVNLNSAVAASGAAAIFKENQYPNFSAEKLKVGNVLQACAISFMCEPGAVNQVATKNFILDRPFAVAVVDNNLGRILFLSAIENPKKRGGSENKKQTILEK
ncbi:MAG: hypothetical protein J6T16_05340 [Opitutales bacterium]|nr:hypothetical protein [Opitutales bacterium]